MFIPKLIMVGLLVLAAAGTVFAQAAKPYVVWGAVYLAVDNEADVWLNGVHIAYYPHTPKASGYKAFVAKPDSLCFFKDSNVLAIRVSASKKDSSENHIGIAYVIRLKLSDGSIQLISSSAADEHRGLYIPHRIAPEPDNWQNIDFDDSAWPTAQSSGNSIPGIASISGAVFGGPAGFLTASNLGYNVQFAGEKQLFRRRFHLDISTNPRCLPSYVAPKPVRRYRLLSSITPVVLPAKKLPLAAPPQLSLPAYRPKPAATATPTSTLPPVVLAPLATDTPTAAPAVTADSSTPTVTASPYPTPRFAPTVVVQDDGSIVFGGSSANILVTFGDGPGFYQVEVVDENLRHLKTIFNQRNISSSEMWLSWDGKDDLGQDVPIGKYFILCSKEAVVLQKIILRRIAPLGNK